MVEKELRDLIESIRVRGCEGQTIEVKAARQGCPERLYDRNKNVRKYWVFWLKCRYSVGINRDVYTFITSFDCRKQPLFR